MTVYIVWWGSTDDEHIIDVFSTEAKAQKFIDEQSRYDQYLMDIQEWKVK